jgi:uncharacterized protein (TIGR04255 family)
MAINEVFPNPTVKNVVFQIRFPSLFYIENKIGDFQLKIMKEFPESAILYRQQVLFADMGPETKIEDIAEKAIQQPGNKVWQFKSPNKYDVNVVSNSLDINSTFHKTYNNPSSGNKFRDTIEFILRNFFSVVRIPLITRIGLRYIDECPITEKRNDTFRKYYNTVFPLDRFKLEDSEELDFKTVVRRGSYYLRFVESLRKTESKHILVLDYDAFATNIEPDNYLNVTDELHDVVISEFEKSIKEPLYQYMRSEPEDGNGSSRNQS